MKRRDLGANLASLLLLLLTFAMRVTEGTQEQVRNNMMRDYSSSNPKFLPPNS